MKWIVLLGWLSICYAVAVLGGRWTSAELRDWYLGLNKPRFSPPNWVFGPVWTLLYTLMAIAAWQVWLLPASSQRSKALLLFIVQLGLSLLWTWLFFREHDIANALADSFLLWVAVGTETALFWQIQRPAAWLMAPYWAWVSFALVVNFAYWRLNPDSN